MPPRGPTDEDLRKLHAEINQLVNQRFLVMMGGITAFGVLAGWLIPKDGQISSTTTEVGGFRYAGAILLMIVLGAFFAYSLQLRKTLRAFSSYLIATKKSNWELDWQDFRRQFSIEGYTRAQTVIFMLLGFLSALLPFGIALVFQLKRTPTEGMWLNIVVGVVYLVTLGILGFSDRRNTEKAFEAMWKDLRPGEGGGAA